ncbi:MAG: hypothetical protein WCO00_04085 [Rhodospirillaceae bacterium]
MSSAVAADRPLTRAFVEPTLASERVLRGILRQIGFALADDSKAADLCVAAVPVDGKLSWCPGSGFAVCDRVATFDPALVLTLETYQRRAGRVDFSGRSFAVCADRSQKGQTLHRCVSTLFHLLLSNGQDVRFLWWFPDAARGVVNYRVDVDDNTGNSFDNVAGMLQSHMKWCSLYFTTSCFTDNLTSIRRSCEAGAEIGSHCHYHYTFERDSATNEKNLCASIGFLRDHGFEVVGAVMPSGKAFPGLGRVMAETGLRYTSNFGLIYDSLPIEVWDDETGYLDIPVHPVAPGNVIKASTTLSGIDDYLIEYYLEAADHLSGAFLPLFFYGHNNDTVRLALLPRLLEELEARFPDHAFLRLDHYAAFWQRRLRRLASGAHRADGPISHALITHTSPDQVSVIGADGVKTWPLALDTLLRSPLSIVGEGTRKPRLRDRVADRFEFETVLPISALSLLSHQGWKSAGYKILHRIIRALIR